MDRVDRDSLTKEEAENMREKVSSAGYAVPISDTELEQKLKERKEKYGY